MLVKIKPWDEAVKAALADDKNWHVENGSIFGISSEYGAWGEAIEGHKDGKYFRNGNHFAYPLCVVDEITEDDDGSVNPDGILRYGKVITDDQMHTINVDVDRRPVTGDARIRLISYEGNLYYHKMVNGDVVECREVGRVDA